MKMHYVYILYSPGHDRYYVGQTLDLSARMLFHNELSERSFTSKYRPWVLKQAIVVKDRSEALKIERYIKGRKSRAFVEELAEDDADAAMARLRSLLSSGG